DVCSSDLKAGSRRGAPRNDKYVKADSVRLREKSRHPYAKNAKGWAPRQKADSSPIKRIRNDKYMKAGSSRGAPPIDKYVKADSVRLNGKVPTLSQKARKNGAPRQKADSSPLKRIRNDKYLKAGSRRGAPRNDKCVKADSVRLREKSPHPGG